MVERVVGLKVVEHIDVGCYDARRHASRGEDSFDDGSLYLIKGFVKIGSSTSEVLLSDSDVFEVQSQSVPCIFGALTRSAGVEFMHIPLPHPR